MLFLLFFAYIHRVEACNYRTIVLRGDTLGVPCCEGDQRDEAGDGTLPPLPPTQAPTTGPTPGPVIPVGDCVCGTGFRLQEEGSNELNRPWAVHITIRSQTAETIECSGSLISKKWIISAAHCFCSTLQSFRCGLLERGFQKILPGESVGDSISLRFGTLAAAASRDPISEIAQIVLHPDYWEDISNNAKGNPADVALIQTTQDIYSGDGLVVDGATVIQPICLPPPGPVSWNQTNNGEPGGPALIAFEDLDCKIRFGDGIGLSTDFKLEVGKLTCHAAAFTSPLDINVGGRTSYLTAFGSTSQVAAGICRANSYSPDQAVFRACESSCEREEENPSLQSAPCQELADSPFLDTLLNNATVGRVVISKDTVEEFCYPWRNPQQFTIFGEHPFRGGWCNTKCDPSVDNCQGGSTAWGWCVDGCEKNTSSDFSRKIHEIQVDSFVYENCSNNVDTFSEFCTGSPIIRPRQHNIRKVDGEFQHYRTDPEVWHPADIGWNGNSTIIRAGSRYQGRQHADHCFGDAGGSVWKYWKFKDPTGLTAERPERGTLAVLTGVVSRFEGNCGAFQGGVGEKDQPNLPTQHTVHSRVQQHLSWIMQTAFSEASCGRLPTTSAAPTPTTMSNSTVPVTATTTTQASATEGTTDTATATAPASVSVRSGRKEAAADLVDFNEYAQEEISHEENFEYSYVAPRVDTIQTKEVEVEAIRGEPDEFEYAYVAPRINRPQPRHSFDDQA